MKRSPTHWKFRQYDRNDRLFWASSYGDVQKEIYKGSDDERAFIAAQSELSNNLADEGESDMLDVYFRSATEPATLFGRLYNDTIVDTDTLALISGEPSTNGYGSVSYATDATDWPTLGLDGGDFQVESLVRTFSASGGSWGPVDTAILATVSTGTAGLLIAYVSLSSSRTLADGESLDVSFDVKLA